MGRVLVEPREDAQRPETDENSKLKDDASKFLAVW